MMIQGFPNLAHVVREFFLCEYAFEITYLNHPSVRVAHHKGIWSLVRHDKTGTITDAFEIDDFAQHPAIVFSPPSGLIRGFLSSKLPDSETITRTKIANALTELIHFWGGPLEEIHTINVIQPGRNASLSETGEFVLAPRPEDWKK